MDELMGSRIKKARLKKGLTLKEAGESIGSSESTFSRYESGYVENIPLQKVDAIAKLFGVTPSYLMGWTEDETSKEVESEEDEIRAIAAHAAGDLSEESIQKIMEFAKFIKSQENKK